MEVDENAGFAELVQQAEQLTAEIDGTSELPRVERNLRQILEAGQELWSKTTQTTAKGTSDVKASILLGTKGYDLMKFSNKLDKLSTSKALEATECVQETDIHGFLKNERENAILSLVEDCKKKTFELVQKHYTQNFLADWEQQKNQILYSMLTSNKEVVDISMDVPETIQTSPITMRTRSALNTIEMAYAKEIFLYNEHVIHGSTPTYNLTERFYTMTKELNEKNVADLWEQVKYMIDIPYYAESDIYQLRTSPPIQQAFITQAIKYLEMKYLVYVQTVVESNRQLAQLGGFPGTDNKVKSFLKIKMTIYPQGLEDGHVDHIPVWPLIYYCMRCGDLEAALRVATSAGDNLADFTTYLKEYISSQNQHLSQSNERHVKMLYGRVIKTSTDPYKRIVYSILGCCDISDNHMEVANRTDDYLWMRLRQLRPEDTDISQDKLTLPKFQTLLYEEYGETHFDAYKQPFLYFKRKLLALPAGPQAAFLSQLPSDRSQLRRLNFARLIRLYIQKFESTDPREAIQYLYLLKDLKDVHGEDLFVTSVTELVQETKEYEMLLGKMEPDGCRKPGLLDKFQEDTGKIIEMVARDSEAKGNIEEAIQLYDLANKPERVLLLLNQLLAPLVSQDPAESSNRNRLEAYALGIAERYRTLDHHGDPQVTDTFFLLLDLMTFFNQYHQKQSTQALDTLRRLRIVPLNPEEVLEKALCLAGYTEEIRRNLLDIMLAAMNIIYSQYRALKSKGQTANLSSTASQLELAEQEQHIAFLRKQAETIGTFAGQISYHLPSDALSRVTTRANSEVMRREEVDRVSVNSLTLRRVLRSDYCKGDRRKVKTEKPQTGQLQLYLVRKYSLPFVRSLVRGVAGARVLQTGGPRKESITLQSRSYFLVEFIGVFHFVTLRQRFTRSVHVVQAMIIMKKCPMRDSNPGRSGRKLNSLTSLPPTPHVKFETFDGVCQEELTTIMTGLRNLSINLYTVHCNLIISKFLVHVVQAMIIMVGRSRSLLL
ncbi:NUP93, partial [Cordylochernes scorpioides]